MAAGAQARQAEVSPEVAFFWISIAVLFAVWAIAYARRERR